MKKLLVILVMLLMQNVFAKPFPAFYRNSSELATETISKEEVNFLRKYNVLNKEHKNAMDTLLDLLYKQEKEKKLRKK